jgi:hypothetical protein
MAWNGMGKALVVGGMCLVRCASGVVYDEEESS